MADPAVDQLFAPLMKGGPRTAPNPVDELFAPLMETQKGDVALPNTPGNRAVSESMFNPEPDVDYASGAPLQVRYNVSRASNPKEEEDYLKKYYGEGNYRKDTGGQWLVRGAESDPWRALYPRGSILGSAGTLGAELAAGAPPVAAGIGGAAVGTVLGGPPGGVAGMFAGAAGGNLADEGIKGLQGFYDKTPGELAMNTLGIASLNSAFQAFPWLKNALRNSTYNTTSRLLRSVSGATPESQAVTQSLEPYNVRPPIGVIAPDLKRTEYFRRLRNLEHGDPRAAERAQAVQTRIGEVFDQLNLPPAERDAAMRQINDVATATGGGDTGLNVVAAMQAAQRDSDIYVQAHLDNARQALRRAFDTYSAASQRTPLQRPGMTWEAAQPKLAQGLRATMEDERHNFTTAMNTAADEFHNAFGGARVINMSEPLELVKDMVNPTPQPLRKILALDAEREAEMPPDSIAPNVPVSEVKALLKWAATKGSPSKEALASIKQMAAEGAEDDSTMLTVKEAHNIRNALVERMRYTGDVAPVGFSRGEISQLISSIDKAFADASVDLGGNAGDMLREFNRKYAEGVVKFTNNDINKILQQTRAGRAPDPGVVADAIMNRDSVQATKQIYDLLPVEMQGAVQQADLKNIFRAATAPTDAYGMRTLDPDKLLRELDKREDMHRVMYGRNDAFIRELRSMALDFMALRETINVRDLPVGSLTRRAEGTASADIRNSLRTALDEHDRVAREAANNALAALRADDPRLIEQGAKFILKSEARTLRAAQLLRTDTPEWRTLVREGVTAMFRDAMVPLPKGVGRTIDTKQLENSLGSLSERQQRMLFQGSMYDDIRLLVRQSRALFPELAADTGTSMAAASTLGANLKKFFEKAVVSRFMGAIADSPQLANLVAGTIRNDPVRGRRLLGYLMQGGANTFANQTAKGEAQPEGGSDFQRELDALEQSHRPVPKPGYKGPEL